MSGTHSIQTGSMRTERGHVSVREVRGALVVVAAAGVILVTALLMKDAGAIVGTLDAGRTVSGLLVVVIDLVGAAVILSAPQVARRLIVPGGRPKRR